MKIYYVVETFSPTLKVWIQRDRRFYSIDELHSSGYLDGVKQVYRLWNIVKITIEIVETSMNERESEQLLP